MIKIVIEDPSDIQYMSIKETNGALLISIDDTNDYFTVPICEVQFGKDIVQAIKNHFKEKENEKDTAI